jgi:xanthine dehydrogenase large subunit
MNAPTEHLVRSRYATVGDALAHDSAHLHVSGRATYADDVREPQGTLHAAIAYSPIARGVLRGVDLTDTLASEDVIAAFTAKDIPGQNLYGAITHDEPFLADDRVEFVGQPIAIVVARSRDAARRAARKAKFDIAEETPIRRDRTRHARRNARERDASSERRIGDRRARALLSRRPNRARHST